MENTKLKTYLYFHAGSENHGCEAIVRSTCTLLGTRPVLISDNPEQDYKYGLDKVVDIKRKSKITFNLIEKMLIKLFGDRIAYDLLSKHEAEDFEDGSIAFSIGGDNYCYGDAYNRHLAGLNKYLHKRNVKTVLWGCSIEPNTVTKNMKKDFALYDYIVARESISYNFLKKINPNTYFACDPAFILEAKECKLPTNFIQNKMVGINISPLIQKREAIKGVTIENYKVLINYIINETEYNIALIPHVVEQGNDDRDPLNTLYDYIEDKSRVYLAKDCSCDELKYIISNCSFFIGARTHATIAAYSSLVPTLVVGYSTKAVGIAEDIFGKKNNYVLCVHDLFLPDQLASTFKDLRLTADTMKKQLRNYVLNYNTSIINITKELKQK